MKGTRVLVTGGAGFVGSHLVEALLREGHTVRVVDALVPQVHGTARVPKYLPTKDVEFIKADVRRPQTWRRVLKGIRVVFHQAAEVGVGQSMYEITKYMDTNTMGTSVMWQELITGKYPAQKILVASSMSIYGEGQYRCRTHGAVYPALRAESQLRRRDWEMRCPRCHTPVAAEPTSEEKPLMPTSVYAISKRDQEELSLSIGRAYGIPVVALRYFNIYGPRQSLSNPYTGVAAIFSSRLRNGHSPVIFEDGRQSRDFIHVSDIVRANLLAMKRREADDETFNVGTGVATSVGRVAELLAEYLEVPIKPTIVGKFRAGDIRHCVADVSKIKRRLGFEATVRFEDGLSDLVRWVQEEEAVDRVDRATKELATRGLVR
jgi:dTDP-L-rhamnose 4-epimerase